MAATIDAPAIFKGTRDYIAKIKKKKKQKKKYT
jgi:hypothetical protein